VDVPADQAADRGAQAFLGKPVDPQQLIEATKRLIRT
jgi:FixJ family two-component response regulator